MKNLSGNDSNDGENLFRRSLKCHICTKLLNEYTVKDHCHLTGKFGGAAYSKYCLQYGVNILFPVFFQNFPGYDAHLFVKNLYHVSIPGGVSLFSLNKE